MKYPILINATFFLSTTFCFGQSTIKKPTVTHFNVVFAPDLSNRVNSKLYPKPVKDVQIVSDVLNRLFPDILRIKRSVQQMDKFSVDFINKGLIGIYSVQTSKMEIDFAQFDLKQQSRIEYITNKSHKKLKNDVQSFNSEFQRVNDRAANSNHGADIWTYFNSGVGPNLIMSNFTRSGVPNVYRNILILLTDGYIEAGIFNKGYDLSKVKVDDFRKAFMKSRLGLAEFLQQNPKFKIKPARNPYLQNLEVLVLEMYDRSLSKSGAATKHPTDMEIMKVIWSDWLKESGVKRFELKSIASSPQEVNDFIVNYLKSSTLKS